MKTTVKTKAQCGVSVEPGNAPGSVRLVIVEGGFVMAETTLNQDQAGVLIFGLECAAEAAQIKADREAKAA